MTTEKVDALVAEIARLHGLDPERLRCKRRTAKIAAARQEAYYRVRLATWWSYPEIGRYFGRHHSSIILGIRRHLQRVSNGNEDGSA